MHYGRGSGNRRHEPDLLPSPKILVGFVNPVSAGRGEDVQIHRILESYSFMRHVRRNAKYLARVDHNLFAIDIKLQRAFDDVGQLLVLMAMQRYDASLLEEHASEHNFLTEYELPLQQRV